MADLLNEAEEKELNQAYYKTETELDHPVQATVAGTIPSWLSGSLTRVGSGKFEWGDDHYNHAFDGDAILHSFTIQNGTVMFNARFLRSNSYKESDKHQRIMRSQFGTLSVPDPCVNMFWKFFSYFKLPIMTDNCNVNLYKIHGKIYSATEATELWHVNPITLQTLDMLQLEKRLSGKRSWPAHPHYDHNGDLLQVSVNYMTSKLEVIRMKNSDPDDIKVMFSIPVKKFCYIHSFAITENYLVIFQNPMHFEVYYGPLMKVMGWSYADLFKWQPKQRSKVLFISKKTWTLEFVYSIQPLFIFHHINAFEKGGVIHVDVVGYNSGEVMRTLFLDTLRNHPEIVNDHPSEIRRYTFPERAKCDQNLAGEISLPTNDDGTDFDMLLRGPELPVINYAQFNGRPYKFAYFTSFRSLSKVNMTTKDVLTWSRENCIPSEPVFVASPDATAEDDGVVLSSVTGVRGQASFMLILDGQTFKEIARAVVDSHRVPKSWHGMFEAVSS